MINSQITKDLNFLKEIKEDLVKNGYQRGGMAATMISDWISELESKLKSRDVKSQYFLFGSDAVKMYEEGEQTLLKYCKGNEPFAVVEFDSESSPTDLLNQYHEWGDYCVITEDLFKKLVEVGG